ncbi:MAG: 30S ribosomal protein S3 [Patescibacteria group bacterium]
MGKKINPKVFRLNTVLEHNSKWFCAKQNFPKMLEEDTRIRKYIKNKFENSGVSKIEIKRSGGNIEVILNTSKPGVIIGRGGAGVEEIKKEIKKKFFGSKKIKIIITITEISKPDLDAELIRQNMAMQILKRMPFRRVMKRAIEQAKRAGAKGIKVIASGRLNGVEIARTESLTDGKIPTHTLRANIDYSRGKVNTLYGTIGLKVWIYKGDVFDFAKTEDNEKENKTTGRNNRRQSKAPVAKLNNRVKKTINQDKEK